MAQAPAINQLSKGAIGFTQALIDQANGIWLLTGSAAPTNSVTGAGFAGVGSLYIAYGTGKLYINTGTKSAPTWTVVGAQS